MPRIDVEALETRTGSRYPAPYDEPCRAKEVTPLGDPAGLTQFGVNLVRLGPGVWSSQRHWHAEEDEFVHVLEGEVILVTDAGQETMYAGDNAGFAAGVRDGHHFINDSEEDVVLLVVGSRKGEDWGEYPDLDMRFVAKGYETKDGKTL